MGCISIYCGTGRGKTPAAFGEALRRASQGDSVVIIQFLKGKAVPENDIMKRLEPEIKIFRFEKSDSNFDTLSKQQQDEEKVNIINGLNFARKVLSTGECDLLVLDEILGIVDNGIMDVSELIDALNQRAENMDVIMTGIELDDRIKAISDRISGISNI